MSEMEKAHSYSWMNVFTNNQEKDFLDKATVYLIFKLYHLR